ncbi:polyprenyl synthetase family protein [Croceimicrobium hydrocarbonivorans]|uniref:Polyprenyl synthetase family protein n=1 Tax=Croceimicrobium hydrocarbonivorans TaxID=2761580 RepID=A0A7H0VAR5_9FLAO|nr:polyprenyl synthetase family protein [Croceimicrobium hydrocarbonivorans]QNR22813.1 polyprenyl synthetase family protein [Croceimicrobium hydrocarbonivorans]
MSSLKKIQAPIQEEMKAFEPKFRDYMASKVALLDRITYYIVKRKGKQLRPMLVFLSAKLQGDIGDSSYRGAALVELMHTATLVHDDVVDDSNMRRGFFSLNALWKNKIAVLVGDYLLSRVLLLSVQNKEHQLLELISTAVQEMSEGELLQIEKARRLDIDEKVYFDIITKKTASLIAACCAVGTASVNSDKEEIEKMRLFGEYLGIAFQIKDDLFDFQQSAKTGKPTGIDIQEQKMTLPLIYALRTAEPADKKFMIRVVKRYNHDRKKVEQVMAMVRNSGGIEYASEQMENYYQKALQILDQYPDSPAKNSLLELAEYVIQRSK